MKVKFTHLIFIYLFFFTPLIYSQNFTNIAPALNIDNNSAKDGGVGWADFNNDGCLDLIFNTNSNNNNNRTRIFFSDCSLPNPGFTDVTASHADGIRQTKCERSVSIGDFNNDGNLDFCRNTHNRIEVYLNNGPLASPAYSFGGATQTANFVLTNIPGGLNSEGLGWMDYDGDGWLDLIIENHNFGIDIYRNPADGTADFVHETPNNSTNGLPSGGVTGDYMTLCDYNDDGLVDIFARKEGELDIWKNSGTGTFVANTSFDQEANNSNKGGVIYCDFDNDGDFDLFWSDEGVNQIYQQTGLNSGNFVATNQPGLSSGVTIGNDVDGCSCGDVDNDGDMDLYLGGVGIGGSFLFLNNGSKDFSFTFNNLGITSTGNSEGNSFADYDNDGDLDLYINTDGNGNELWQNDLNNNNYIKVDVLKDLGNGIFRDDLGATAILKNCSGDILGGIRQVSSVKGHGSNDPAVIHFGLPLGNDVPYTIEIHYTTEQGVRAFLDTTIVPSALTNQRISLVKPSGNGSLDGCRIFFLPIELNYFDAVVIQDEVHLKWETESETNNDFFTLERSKDGITWTAISQIESQSNLSQTIYNYVDEFPLAGISYYRLKQTDFDGQSTYSKTKAVQLNQEEINQVRLYPNPTKEILTVEGHEEEMSRINIYNSAGQNVTQKINFSAINAQIMELDLSNLSPGLYFLKTKTAIRKVNKI